MPTLNWIGREAVINHHNEIPYRLLRCNGELSVGDSGNGNLLVEGDNLEALKALLPYYAGQVKCIYIDPPYNKGETSWVYSDDVRSPGIQSWLGRVVGKEAEDLSRHDKWLCMMYPRMQLLVQFLRPGGFLLVSLDETEVARFRLMMEEILSPTSYITTLNWKSRRNIDNRSLHNVSVDHEYVVAYRIGNGAFRGAEKDMSKYSNPDNDPRGPWMSDNLVGLATKDRRPNLHYDLVNPETGDVYPCPEKGWRYSKETMAQKIAKRRIIWPSRKGGRPRHKKFAADLRGEYAGFSSFIDCGNTNEGTEEVSQIMGGEQFIFPKPRSLIQTLLRQTTAGDDIILDSFAGTGTTAHAILALNAEDGGSRRFILVEMEPHIARSITAERVQRVIEGYEFTGTGRTLLFERKLTVTAFKKSTAILEHMDAIREQCQGEYDSFERRVENGKIVLYGKKKIEGFKEGMGGGFRYCTLGPPLFDETGAIRPEVSFNDLAAHVYFTETGEPLSERPSRNSPLIGQAGDTAYYLFFNGVRGGSLLDARTLRRIEEHAGPVVVYADGCTLSAAMLKQHNVTFKQTPYEVTTR